MDVFIGTQCTFNKVEIIRNAVIEETGTPALTGQFQTCQSCLNCRSAWWLSSCNIIYVLLVCFLHYSPVSGHFTLLRPSYCAFYQTSWQQSTMEILQHWSCWTYLLRSTRSTTTFCCRGYRQASALAVLPSSGSSRT